MIRSFLKGGPGSGSSEIFSGSSPLLYTHAVFRYQEVEMLSSDDPESLQALRILALAAARGALVLAVTVSGGSGSGSPRHTEQSILVSFTLWWFRKFACSIFFFRRFVRLFGWFFAGPVFLLRFWLLWSFGGFSGSVFLSRFFWRFIPFHCSIAFVGFTGGFLVRFFAGFSYNHGHDNDDDQKPDEYPPHGDGRFDITPESEWRSSVYLWCVY